MISLIPLKLVTSTRAQEAYAAFEAIYSRISRLPHIVDFDQLSEQDRDLFDRAAAAYDNYVAELQGEGITEKG